ncbi:MAG: NAD(P)/FAD-dependent oxidoreductase [Oscillospiraceae bacterium]|nr:NAD(P)/FAD-dependent oxidoreductase [Oscillospiraceae bacterium]
MTYDVAVVGAGVVGGLIARELSRFELKTALLERCNDIAMGTSKANSAIVHGGFDAQNGTVKAELNVKGTAMMPEVCKKLSVPYKNNGSLVVAFSDSEMEHVKELYERGVKNGVPRLSVIDRDELRRIEPNISDKAVGALLSESAGIVCPYELTIAAVENAVTNGVELIRNCEVTEILENDGGFTLKTSAGDISAKYIINAAGNFSDELAKMVGDDSIELIPRKGEYYLLDKSVGNLAVHTIFQCPNEMGKGILVTPTVDGNLLIGPTAVNIDDKEDTDTTPEGLLDIVDKALKSVPTVSVRNAITSFAGVRAHPVNDDFIIGWSEKSGNFLNAAGIESPGLSASPAIAIRVREILGEKIELIEKKEYTDTREEPVRFRHMTDEQREELIKKNSAYGRIVCRCETVTEGEIIDAIKAPAGARDVDGVKRRTRAGMGRCQGGFCGSKVVEILARELGVPMNEITKFGGESKIIYERTK